MKKSPFIVAAAAAAAFLSGDAANVGIVGQTPAPTPTPIVRENPCRPGWDHVFVDETEGHGILDSCVRGTWSVTLVRSDLEDPESPLEFNYGIDTADPDAEAVFDPLLVPGW